MFLSQENLVSLASSSQKVNIRLAHVENITLTVLRVFA